MEQTIKDAALDTAQEFASRSKELVKHRQILNQHQFDVEFMTKRVEGEVASESDAATGKPKFPNETMRKAETFARLQGNELFKRVQDLVGHEEDTIAEIMSAIEICKMNMRAYEVAGSYDMIASI